MNNQDYYNKEYVLQVNKIGKITGYLGVLLSFTPALVLAVVYGILPKPAALLTAFISGASAFGKQHHYLIMEHYQSTMTKDLRL